MELLVEDCSPLKFCGEKTSSLKRENLTVLPWLQTCASKKVCLHIHRTFDNEILQCSRNFWWLKKMLKIYTLSLVPIVLGRRSKFTYEAFQGPEWGRNPTESREYWIHLGVPNIPRIPGTHPARRCRRGLSVLITLLTATLTKHLWKSSSEIFDLDQFSESLTIFYRWLFISQKS